MDEFRQNNRLRGALDAALSGLNGDPALAQRVLRCAEEKPRAAKKLSVGLVFALVALLAATGIAAAAAGPSADRAVLEGAIMLARTVVRLAQTPAERDRVLQHQARRVAA